MEIEWNRWVYACSGTRRLAPGNSSRVFLNVFPQATCSKWRRLGGAKRPSTTAPFRARWLRAYRTSRHSPSVRPCVVLCGPVWPCAALCGLLDYSPRSYWIIPRGPIGLFPEGLLDYSRGPIGLFPIILDFMCFSRRMDMFFQKTTRRRQRGQRRPQLLKYRNIKIPQNT